MELLDSKKEFKQGNGFFNSKKGPYPLVCKATDIFHNVGLNSVKRVERGVYYDVEFDPKKHSSLFDRMTEGVYKDVSDIFVSPQPAPLEYVDILSKGKPALDDANIKMGLALSQEEIDYLYTVYSNIKGTQQM